MVSMVWVSTSIKTGNPLFFKMCQIKSELLHISYFVCEPFQLINHPV